MYIKGILTLYGIHFLFSIKTNLSFLWQNSAYKKVNNSLNLKVVIFKSKHKFRVCRIQPKGKRIEKALLLED